MTGNPNEFWTAEAQALLLSHTLTLQVSTRQTFSNTAWLVRRQGVPSILDKEWASPREAMAELRHGDVMLCSSQSAPCWRLSALYASNSYIIHTLGEASCGLCIKFIIDTVYEKSPLHDSWIQLAEQCSLFVVVRTENLDIGSSCIDAYEIKMASSSSSSQFLTRIT